MFAPTLAAWSRWLAWGIALTGMTSVVLHMVIFAGYAVPSVAAWMQSKGSVSTLGTISVIGEASYTLALFVAFGLVVAFRRRLRLLIAQCPPKE